MSDQTLIQRYNYDSFTPAKFEPWLSFENSPPLGLPAPDFPLWYPDGKEIRLYDLFAEHRFTIIEFGSFT